MRGRKQILLVDDDDALRSTLSEQIEQREDMAVASVATGQEALDAARDRHFDLILLDLKLPDMDGFEVCRRLRDSGLRAPIIMLTGADTEENEIRVLEHANDYIGKPFKVAVLLARISGQLRQHEQSDDAVFLIGPYGFRPAHKMLIHRETDKKLRLTEKEAAILKYLYRAGEKAVSRETLLHEVWGYNAGVTTHTLETHVYRLRQKIEPDPADVRLLITEPGGYRLAP